MSSKVIILLIIVSITAIGLALFGQFFKRPWPKQTEITINGHRWQVEVVSDSWSRAKGLSGRDNLPTNKGMLFIFDESAQHSFWMKGMKFPLDIVWINNNRVVDITYNAQPLSLIPPPSSLTAMILQPAQPAKMILEINAGSATRAGLKIGNQVRFK